VSYGYRVRLAGAVALGALTAMANGSAIAREGDRVRVADRCGRETASGLRAADQASCEAQRSETRTINLNLPFEPFDLTELWQQRALPDKGVRRARGGGLFSFADQFDFNDVLSKSDLLVLKATSLDPSPSVETLGSESERVVAGLSELQSSSETGSWMPRPEVSSYLANQMAGLSIATQSVRALRDRLDAGRPEEGGFSLWVRAVGQEDGIGGDASALYQSATDTTVVHAGVDYAYGDLSSEVDGLHLGLLASYGKSVSDGNVVGNPALARSVVTALRVGAYSTWYENEVDRTGLYIDGWAGYTILRNAVAGQDLPLESYSAGAWAASVETGYAWELFGDEGLRVEPQLQVLYSGYGQGAHFETNGTAVEGSAGRISTRLGVRFDQTWRIEGGAQLKPHAEVNWHHDLDGAHVTFDGVAVESVAPRDRFEFSVGVDAKFENNWSAGLNVQTEHGANDYSGIEALVSVKYVW
jgi:outer membrane autotransporter protein